MRMLFLAAVFALGMASACSPQGPQVDEERVAANRAAIANCQTASWEPCRGGFVRFDDNRVQVIRLDPAAAPEPGTAGADEITTGFLNASVGDDVFLNGFVIILPDDEGAWSEAAVAHARQQTVQRTVTETPAEEAAK